ncbi:hypothetical protein VB264_00060 [Arcicella aquatica]|uniref:DUF4234 domain-containing protein n=1 Tax=Arcicella aquatica TaxID=217141 RepID=A0ABU5QGG6_9BACT|nr:hypothetical protein [Arcicella aquatica]MEA5256155.1 hypothetical protein [Arcicella aquatica]
MENTEEVLAKNDNVEIQYIISTKKFIILSIFTFGFYITWWHYKAWRFFNQKDQLDIMPAIRATNGVFFIYSILRMILKFAQEKGYSKKYPSALYSLVFIILVLPSLPPLYFSLPEILSLILLIQPFQALNFAKRQSNDLRVIEQTNFNRRQKALLFIGGWCWISIIAETFLNIN